MERTCDLFLDHLRVERNLSPRTVQGYGADLAGLRQALSEQGVTDVRDVREANIARWLQGLAARGVGPRGQARALSAGRRLFVYALRQGLISESPMADVRGPKLGRRLPRVLEREQAVSVATSSRGETARALRDRALVELLYGAGLRATEACSISLDDVQVARGLLRVPGKGGRERLVPMGEAAQRAVQAYLRTGRPKHPKAAQSKYLFVGKGRGGRLSRVTVFRIVDRAARVAGVQGTVSPHKLRHAFATHLLQGGADLRSVQELLGHASVTTTEIYTHVGSAQTRAVVDRCHPLGRELPKPKESC